jgi:hypothetical protein
LIPLSGPSKNVKTATHNAQQCSEIRYTDKHLHDRHSYLGLTTDQLILPFLEVEIGISALRLDDTLHIGVSYAHAELKRCWCAHCPVVYGFCGIDAAAFNCGK